MPKYNFDWSFSNSKLKKENTVAFNIPALRSSDGFTTCPNAGICAGLCYAQQGRYTMLSVQAPRERNLLKLRQMTNPADHNNSGWGWIDVEAELIMDIDQLPPRITQVRIHDSGDFFDAEYLYTWLRVARYHHDMVFYAYTKQIALLQEFAADGAIPDNMYLVQSIGGKQDHLIDLALPHSRIFPTMGALEASPYIDCTHTDKPVYQGARRIGLCYHGTRSLSNAQVNALNQINL